MSEQAPQPTIAQVNDAFRKAGPGEGWIVTSGAMALPDFPGLIQAVVDFDDFNEDNDPHSEHDFGAINWHQEQTFWRIDYYDQQLQAWEDPLSPDCRRVLTMMLASEY